MHQMAGLTKSKIAWYIVLVVGVILFTPLNLAAAG